MGFEGEGGKLLGRRRHIESCICRNLGKTLLGLYSG
jgi:hypothetical protein